MPLDPLTLPKLKRHPGSEPREGPQPQANADGRQHQPANEVWDVCHENSLLGGVGVAGESVSEQVVPEVEPEITEQIHGEKNDRVLHGALRWNFVRAITCAGPLAVVAPTVTSKASRAGLQGGGQFRRGHQPPRTEDTFHPGSLTAD